MTNIKVDRYAIVNMDTRTIVQTEYWLEIAVEVRNTLNFHESANGRPRVYEVQNIDTGVVIIDPDHHIKTEKQESYDRFINVGSFK